MQGVNMHLIHRSYCRGRKTFLAKKNPKQTISAITYVNAHIYLKKKTNKPLKPYLVTLYIYLKTKRISKKLCL